MDFELGLRNPKLVKIPKGVYHGFKCISKEEAIVVNIPTLPYDKEKPDEYRIDPFDNNIKYDWKK
jgi:dTDP-4-dehydrorhamnose 3,5-epimerase